MPRLSVRRSRTLAGTLALAAGGLAAGFVGGFLAGGLLGPVRIRQAVTDWRTEKPEPSTAGGAAAAIRTALAGDPVLAKAELRVIPVHRRRVELHGWVASRREGARTLRLAREAAPGLDVVGRLRVRGEDDRSPGDEQDERLPA